MATDGLGILFETFDFRDFARAGNVEYAYFDISLRIGVGIEQQSLFSNETPFFVVEGAAGGRNPSRIFFFAGVPPIVEHELTSQDASEKKEQL